MKKVLYALLLSVLAASCGGTKKAQDAGEQKANPVAVTFNADSAYAFCEQQCQFGPRVMNSEAHELCGQWIARKFRSYGLEVVEQKATLRGYDGTPLQSTNIIASYKPGVAPRLLVCAHWDSRPWADNDPDEANHRKPVMAANDGASGVAVMLEAARLLPDSLGVGIDFVCFDAEDWGIPQWADAEDPGDTWALGAQHWAANPHCDPNTIRFGILLDMVGGQQARFYREGYSMQRAKKVVDKVWKAADVAGYSSYFLQEDCGWVTDDHVPVNDVAGIPCIDIINHYPACEQSSFGPTWHTIHDDMEHIDRQTLKAVGQTLLQVLFTE
jgi:Zn-dependent M28 family amino/carboxypeptidase